MSFEIAKIRVLGWLRSLVRLASIGMVLFGVYTASVGARMGPHVFAVDYYGVTVGVVKLGHLVFRPDEALILAGVAIMITGLAIATRTVMDTSRAPAWY